LNLKKISKPKSFKSSSNIGKVKIQLPLEIKDKHSGTCLKDSIKNGVNTTKNSNCIANKYSGVEPSKKGSETSISNENVIFIIFNFESKENYKTIFQKPI